MKRRRSLVLSAGLMLAIASTACGSTQTGVTTPRARVGDQAQISGSLNTLSVAGDGRGGAVVHTRVVEGSPRTVVSNLANGRDTVLPSTAPLLAPTIWASPTAFGVIGALCPTWKSAEAPHWEDHSERNIPELCGVIDYRGWTVDRSSGVASPIQVSALRGTNGVGALGTRSDVVLLLTRGFESADYELDAVTGELTALPPNLDTGGSAEAQVVICLGHDAKAFAVMAWTGQAPASVSAGDWKDKTVTLDDGSSAVAAIPGDDQQWKPIPMTGNARTFDGQKGCSSSGVWVVGPNGGARIDVDAGMAELSVVPAPPSGKSRDVDASVNVLWDGGPPLAMVQPLLQAETVDRPRSTTGYLWQAGHWQAIPTVDVDPSSVVFQNGESIAAMQARPDAGDLYELDRK